MLTSRQIFTTFSTVTEESAANGETAEHGWYSGGFRFDSEDRPDEGFICDPDDYDIADGLTAVDLAVDYLKGVGVIGASSSNFHPGVWFHTERETEDYSSGESIEYCFHLDGFDDNELKEIFRRVIR